MNALIRRRYLVPNLLPVLLGVIGLSVLFGFVAWAVTTGQEANRKSVAVATPITQTPEMWRENLQETRQRHGSKHSFARCLARAHAALEVMPVNEKEGRALDKEAANCLAAARSVAVTEDQRRHWNLRAEPLGLDMFDVPPAPGPGMVPQVMPVGKFPLQSKFPVSKPEKL
jgi:hypothetical protein